MPRPAPARVGECRMNGAECGQEVCWQVRLLINLASVILARRAIKSPEDERLAYATLDLQHSVHQLLRRKEDGFPSLQRYPPLLLAPVGTLDFHFELPSAVRTPVREHSDDGDLPGVLWVVAVGVSILVPGLEVLVRAVGRVLGLLVLALQASARVRLEQREVLVAHVPDQVGEALMEEGALRHGVEPGHPGVPVVVPSLPFVVRVATTFVLHLRWLRALPLQEVHGSLQKLLVERVLHDHELRMLLPQPEVGRRQALGARRECLRRAGQPGQGAGRRERPARQRPEGPRRLRSQLCRLALAMGRSSRRRWKGRRRGVVPRLLGGCSPVQAA
mmetsp:Transcript_31401/g.84288  ORF Transcript_31401/g.84288 Transcript_31401/m.84288 type:complete len:332 (-) Transcript_31401:1-996(-)